MTDTPLPETPAAPRRLNWRLVVTVAVGVAGGLLLAELLQGVVVRLYDLLVTVVVSLFISFALEPAVQWLDDRGIRRGGGTALVFLASFMIIAGFLAAMAPLVIGQATTLIEQGPRMLGNLAEQARTLPAAVGEPLSMWLEEQQTELPRRLPELAPRIAGGALGFGQTLLGTVLQMLTVLLVSFYLVADGPKLRRVLSSRMDPDQQREFLAWWDLAIGKTGGYLYSRLLTAVISAVFHVTVFTVVGVPYPTALGVWVGLVSSLIPVIGTYLAGALPLLVALTGDPFDAVWVLVAIVGYQQVENYLVAPKVTEHALALHPAVAFMSVLIGGALLGPVGALLALPAAAIVAALASAHGERHEVLEHDLTTQRTPPADGVLPPNLRRPRRDPPPAE